MVFKSIVRLLAMLVVNGVKQVMASDVPADGIDYITLTGHGDTVNSAAFSPNCTRIVTTSNDGTACVRNVRTKARELVLRGHVAPNLSAVFSLMGLALLLYQKIGLLAYGMPAQVIVCKY